ncbi:MAG: hypothetical protein Fur0040_10190 [Sideroxydans sp.]
MLRFLPWLLLLLAVGARAELPSRIEARYDLIGKGVKLGEVREVFVRQQDRYRVESVTRPVGLLALFQPETIVVTSEGEIDADGGLRPLRFTHRRTRDSFRNSQADFDWSAGELTLNDQNGIRQVALTPGVQDRLSIMYQLVAQPPRAKLELKFSMTNGSKLESYHYQIYPDQTVSVPFGTVKAHYLYTLPQKTAWKSEIWLATEHAYFPCKLVLTDDSGEKLTQALTHLTLTP